MSVSQGEILAQHGEPSSSPYPVAEERINHRSDKPAIDEEERNFHRSAMAPVGIVAVASIKTV